MITNTAATNDVSIEGPEIKESLKVEDAQHGEVGEIDILSASVSNCLVPVLGRGTEGWNPWDAYLFFCSFSGRSARWGSASPSSSSSSSSGCSG